MLSVVCSFRFRPPRARRGGYPKHCQTDSSGGRSQHVYPTPTTPTPFHPPITSAPPPPRRPRHGGCFGTRSPFFRPFQPLRPITSHRSLSRAFHFLPTVSYTSPPYVYVHRPSLVFERIGVESMNEWTNEPIVELTTLARGGPEASRASREAGQGAVPEGGARRPCNPPRHTVKAASTRLFLAAHLTACVWPYTYVARVYS